MPITVASMIIPKGGAKWPVLDDTYIRGGIRAVQDLAARDAILSDPVAKLGLKVGSFVFTLSDEKTWMYLGNSSWKAQLSAYTHVQTVEATEWNIAHNKSSIDFTYTIFVDGRETESDECIVADNNNLVLRFLNPVKGRATFVFNG